MNHACEVIDLEEFRKRRRSKPSAVRATIPATFWSPVWVWVMTMHSLFGGCTLNQRLVGQGMPLPGGEQLGE